MVVVMVLAFPLLALLITVMSYLQNTIRIVMSLLTDDHMEKICRGKIEIDLKVALKNILDISFFIMLSLIYVVLALWILITKGIFIVHF